MRCWARGIGGVFGAWVLALGACASGAAAHVYPFAFGMRGGHVVPPTDSSALGQGRLTYNHHTFNYSLDLFVSGVGLDDLLGVGPNGTPLQIFYGARGETGDIALDPGYFGEFFEDGEGIRIELEGVRLGGEQGAFETVIWQNEEALYGGELYIQLFTREYPAGEIRGQMPPFGKFLGSPFGADFAPISGPPSRIPAPGGFGVVLAGAWLLGMRRARGGA